MEERKKKLLLVEDDYEYADFIGQRLIREGHEVDITYSSLDAVEKLALKSYDMLISDLHLPVINGIKLINTGKKINPEMLTIILTAKPSEDSELESLSYDVDLYIDKSKSMKIILRYITATLAKQGTNIELERDELFSKNGNIILDRKKHIVTKEGEKVNFTNTEFRILELLMLNQSKLLTRDEIIDAIWVDQEKMDNYRVVDTHIKNIREKLQSFSILTVRGKGYRWND